MEKALVSLTFDDGLRCQFDRALPVLSEHGFTGTFFLVANTDPIHTDRCAHPDWAKTNWSEADIQFLKGMLRLGHEIGAHSMTHRRPELDNDPKFEAEGSKQWIESRLEIEVTSYCYPFCHVTDQIQNAVKQAGYKQARWGANRSYSAQQHDVDLHRVDCRHVAIDNPKRVMVNGILHPVGRDGSENVRGWLQADWYVVMFHGIGSIQDGWWPISESEFARQMKELATLCDSGQVEVVTFADGAERARDRNNVV